MKPFMTLTEAADALGKSEETVRQWAAAGKIPARKIGRSWVIVTEDLIDHIRKGYEVQKCLLSESEKAVPGTSTSRRRLAGYGNRLEQMISEEPSSSMTS